MSLKGDIKFQKALALSAAATNPFEAAAAEAAARRLMETYKIDPTDIPDGSLYSRVDFADNALLGKLRQEWREQHPPPPPEPPRASVNGRRVKADSPSISFSIRGFQAAVKRNKKFIQRRRSAAVNSAIAGMIRKWVYEEPDVSTKELEQRLQQMLQRGELQHSRNFDTIGAIRANTQRVLLELNEMGYLTEPLASRLRP